jgi:hypothetical protein
VSDEVNVRPLQLAWIRTEENAREAARLAVEVDDLIRRTGGYDIEDLSRAFDSMRQRGERLCELATKGQVQISELRASDVQKVRLP